MNTSFYRADKDDVIMRVLSVAVLAVASLVSADTKSLFIVLFHFPVV